MLVLHTNLWHVACVYQQNRFWESVEPFCDHQQCFLLPATNSCHPKTWSEQHILNFYGHPPPHQHHRQLELHLIWWLSGRANANGAETLFSKVHNSLHPHKNINGSIDLQILIWAHNLLVQPFLSKEAMLENWNRRKYLYTETAMFSTWHQNLWKMVLSWVKMQSKVYRINSSWPHLLEDLVLVL